MNNYFVSAIAVTSALLTASLGHAQPHRGIADPAVSIPTQTYNTAVPNYQTVASAQNELAMVYNESADLPEFTKSLRRSEALTKFSPIDTTAVAQPSKWDMEATAAREQLPGMYPEDAERLRNESKKKGRN